MNTDALETVRNSSFVEQARYFSDDVAELIADIELEKVIDLHQVDDRLSTIYTAIDRAIESGEDADDAIEAVTDQADIVVGFVQRIEVVIRELQWTDPDSTVLRDLTSALRGYDKGEVVAYA